MLVVGLLSPAQVSGDVANAFPMSLRVVAFVLSRHRPLRPRHYTYRQVCAPIPAATYPCTATHATSACPSADLNCRPPGDAQSSRPASQAVLLALPHQTGRLAGGGISGSTSSSLL